MKIVCQSCGYENDLGRVFCNKCATRLDLSGVAEEIEREREEESRPRIWQFFLIPPIVLIAAAAAVFLWPHGSLRKAGGSQGKKQSVETAIVVLSRVAQRLSESGTISVTLEEADINAWLAERARSLRARSLSIQLNDEEFVFRVVNNLSSIRVSKKVKLPAVPYSYDVTVSTQQGQFDVRSARIGHFPLGGPPLKVVVSMIENLFKNMRRERLIFDKTSDVRVSDGRIILIVTADG